VLLNCGLGKRYHSIDRTRFLLAFHSYYGLILYHFRDKVIQENCDFLIPHTHSTPPLRRPRRNIAIIFHTEKLSRWGYHKVKKVRICLAVSIQYTNVTGRQTDGRTASHCTTAYAALMHSTTRQNVETGGGTSRWSQ